jgi:hypothetical protein
LTCVSVIADGARRRGGFPAKLAGPSRTIGNN